MIFSTARSSLQNAMVQLNIEAAFCAQFDLCMGEISDHCGTPDINFLKYALLLLNAYLTPQYNLTFLLSVLWRTHIFTVIKLLKLF